MALARVALVAGLASIALVTSARTAHALGPIDVEVAAKAGIGAEYSGGQNPLGFGLGGRVGVVLPTRRMMTFDHLYVGVSAIYSFGTSQTYQYVNGGPYTESVHTLMVGFEAGVGFKPLDNLTIRPQVGIGNASFSRTLTCPTTFAASPGASLGSSCSTDGAPDNLYIEPGVTLLVAFGALFLGGDVNVLVLRDNDDDVPSSLFITLHGQVGVKF